MKIVADAHLPYIEHYFGDCGELQLKPGRSMTAHDLRRADMLLVRSITPVNQYLLENTTVKFVGSVTAGTDHLDVAWLDQANIAWHVARGFNAPPVADYVFSVIAALQKKGLLPSKKMSAAIIGVGAVGRLVAERLTMSGIDVILCDPIRAQHEPDFFSTALTELADVDLISLHVPLTRNGEYPTYHMIAAAFLKRQKTGSVLINTSRGDVIDEAALQQHGQHLQWCLDVWSNEPTINKSLLQQAVIATPHIAGYSKQSKMRGVQMIYHLAREKKIIAAKEKPLLPMFYQPVNFSHWQEAVLNVFDPFAMTERMRDILLPDHAQGVLFDELRRHCHDRSECVFNR